MTECKKKNISVITIDGPSGVGKGTVANRLAQELGWYFLDSGAIYRFLALKIIRLTENFSPTIDAKQTQSPPVEWVNLAKNLNIHFQDQRCYLDNEDVTNAIRQEAVGLMASKASAFPQVRQALLERQRKFAQAPGLVADGRDMGSVVFPDAILKFYLDADSEVRARRRELQLKEQGINVTFAQLLEDIEKRDQQDQSRAIAPLVIPEKAIVINTGMLSKEQVFEKIMSEVRRCLN